MQNRHRFSYFNRHRNFSLMKSEHMWVFRNQHSWAAEPVWTTQVHAPARSPPWNHRLERVLNQSKQLPTVHGHGASALSWVYSKSPIVSVDRHRRCVPLPTPRVFSRALKFPWWCVCLTAGRCVIHTRAVCVRDPTTGVRPRASGWACTAGSGARSACVWVSWESDARLFLKRLDEPGSESGPGPCN